MMVEENRAENRLLQEGFRYNYPWILPTEDREMFDFYVGMQVVCLIWTRNGMTSSLKKMIDACKIEKEIRLKSGTYEQIANDVWNNERKKRASFVEQLIIDYICEVKDFSGLKFMKRLCFHKWYKRMNHEISQEERTNIIMYAKEIIFALDKREQSRKSKN